MVEPEKIFGRLGNQMFQYAFLATYAKEHNIDHYFQDPKFFDHAFIRKLFSQGITPVNKVAIHLRRGDYVRNPFYVDLSVTHYYENALKEFPNEKFLVFSDDIEFAKSYFDGKEFEFSEGNDPITDLNLMAGCKGVIIANSSFSWWAGFLCRGKVVAPKEWYTDKVNRTKLMPQWITL